MSVTTSLIGDVVIQEGCNTSFTNDSLFNKMFNDLRADNLRVCSHQVIYEGEEDGGCCGSVTLCDRDGSSNIPNEIIITCIIIK